jgi:murein peptide amidase A
MEAVVNERSNPPGRAGRYGTTAIAQAVVPQAPRARYANPRPQPGMSTARQIQPLRSIANLLAPLAELSRRSPHLVAASLGRFESQGAYEIPRFHFAGAKGGDDPVRIGIFAAIHGDEPASTHALAQFLTLLEHNPEFATGYDLFAYPVCNPTGFEDGTRESRRGRDLNREFWNQSQEPEVALLEREIRARAFHGLISLHTDDTSPGLYGFVRGATLTQYLLDPALKAAAQLLPRNENQIIDGFSAREGIIRRGYEGVLSAPPKARPRPFEIILETPHEAPQYLQEKALVVALQTILAEYRKLMAYAATL